MFCGLEGLQPPLHVLPENFFILALLFIWRDEVTAVAGLVLAEGEAKRHRVSSWPQGASSIPAPLAGAATQPHATASECSPAAGACRGSLAARGAWQRPPCPGDSAPCRSPAGRGTRRSHSPSCGEGGGGGRWRWQGWATRHILPAPAQTTLSEEGSGRGPARSERCLYSQEVSDRRL